MNKKTITIGLDLSLVRTGYAILEDGKVLDFGLIKSKPSGDLPVNETRRIKKISEDIIWELKEALGKKIPDLILIENLAFMVRNTTALTQLAGLNHIIRIMIDDMDWPFILVAPTSLKKFITGSGKGDKNMMLMSIYKNYGFEALDDNTGDAYGLGVIGLSLLEKPMKKPIKPQEEVINLLKKQLKT